MSDLPNLGSDLYAFAAACGSQLTEWQAGSLKLSRRARRRSPAQHRD